MIKQFLFTVLVGWVMLGSADGATNPCEGVVSGFKPHESDCTQYYSCVNGVAHLLRCPTEFPVFNNGICDFGDPAYCVNCPAEGIARFPVQYSCTRFILCINGVQSEGVCPTGLIFDRTIEQCNLIANAPECTEVSCPAVDDPANPTFLPHPTDCSVYFICVSGEPIRQTCPAGTVFNPTINNCDKPANVVCPAAMRSTSTLLSLVHSKASRSNDGCAGNKGIKNLPDPTDCSQYFMCMNEQQFSVPCGNGMVFDMNTSKCAAPEKSVCIRDATTTANPCEGNSGVKNVPHPSDCNKYYMCMNANKYDLSCQADERFDIVTRKCQKESQATCESQSASVPEPEEVNPCAGNVGIKQVPDPRNCSAFYLCAGEISNHRQCAENLIFDMISNACNRPEDSVCVSDLPVPSTPVITSTPVAETTTPAPTGGTGIPTAPTPAPTVPSAPTAAPTPAPTPSPSPNDPSAPVCTPGELFYYPHPDCSKFYRCVYGTIFVLTCPNNQFWNQNREYCDHFWNVNCPSRKF